jgi:cytochrome c peroxidase
MIRNIQKKVRLALAAGMLAALLGACSGGDLSTGNESSGLSPAAALGENLFFATALSASGRQGCFSCHDPARAFSDPGVVSVGGPDFVPAGGDVPAEGLPGFRNSPSLMYASYTPAFHIEADGTPAGGFFRDGRAASLADQAQKPFVSPFEMANNGPDEVIQRLKAQPDLMQQFTEAYGAAVLDDPKAALQRIGAAIAAFEKEDPRFHPFSSKYDFWFKGKTQMTAQELNGMRLFNDTTRGNCAGCHVDMPLADGTPALFTDFTYDNLGVPRNTEMEVNRDDTALPYVPANSSDGVHRYYDLGLCGPQREPTPRRDDLCGAFKVPTLRDIALSAPYFHNGRFATLAEVVAFYVRRDTSPEQWYPVAGGSITKFDDLPQQYGGQFVVDLGAIGSDRGYVGNVNTAEVPYNRHLGNAPALADDEIADVVAFLCTLTDGFDPHHPGNYALPEQCPQAAGDT